MKCVRSQNEKHEWRGYGDPHHPTCHWCGVERDQQMIELESAEIFLEKRKLFEESNKPGDLRQRKLRDMMRDLSHLLWETYEIDGADKDFHFNHIIPTSNLRPRVLTVRVLHDLEFKDFRELIKEVMIEKKLTLTAAAEILGIGRVAFTNFMLNKADLSVDLALKIQEEFKIDAESMLRMQLRKNLEFIRVRTFQPRF